MAMRNVKGAAPWEPLLITTVQKRCSHSVRQFGIFLKITCCLPFDLALAIQGIYPDEEKNLSPHKKKY